jgi:hypothetical protein
MTIRFEEILKFEGQRSTTIVCMSSLWSYLAGYMLFERLEKRQ